MVACFGLRETWFWSPAGPSLAWIDGACGSRGCSDYLQVPLWLCWSWGSCHQRRSSQNNCHPCQARSSRPLLHICQMNEQMKAVWLLRGLRSVTKNPPHPPMLGVGCCIFKTVVTVCPRKTLVLPCPSVHPRGSCTLASGGSSGPSPLHAWQSSGERGTSSCQVGMTPGCSPP